MAWDNIVKFPDNSNAPRHTQPPVEYEGCSTGYGYARRNRQNPLRQKLRKVEIAVVEINKVQYQHSPRELEHIREGVEAARKLADDLATAAGRIFTKDPIAMSPHMTGEEFAALVATMPTADQEMILTIVRGLVKGYRP